MKNVTTKLKNVTTKLKNTSLFLLLSILRVQLLLKINEWPYLTFVSKLFKILFDTFQSIFDSMEIIVYQSCRTNLKKSLKGTRSLDFGSKNRK